MYFCPCSCSKADCENEEDVLIYLPRNLSYAGESYLDRYSVSSAFVHNGKLEKQLLKADAEEQYLKAGAAACAELRRELEGGGGGGEGGGEEEEGGLEGEGEQPLLGARAMARPVACAGDSALFRGGPDNCDLNASCGVDPTSAMSLQSPATTATATAATSSSSPLLPPLTVSIGREKGSGPPPSSEFDRYVVTTTESPDSDLVSEEGIFVNMMDDLDGLGGGPGGKSTLSEASDDTYVSGDSMYYSPEEVEEMEDEQVRGDHLKVSLEEAVQQAAFTIHAPTTSSSSPPDPPDHASAAAATESSVTLSLPLPHADNGESEDGGTTTTTTTTTTHDAENSDSSGGGGDGSGVTTTTAGEDGSAASPKEDSHDQTSTPQGPPSPPPPPPQPTKNRELEIQLTDMSSSSGGGGGGGGGVLQPPSEERGPGLGSSSLHDLLSPSSPLYEDREFNFTRTELRKSTSLKSTKTPPGTPRRKKVVRFADAMGLDLESVRHVLNLESPPKIPPSAMKDLQAGLSEDRKGMGSRYITETFSQPGADPRFRERVMGEKVVLENALIVSGSITGVVRVANLSFHKTVRVRFTTNGWASFHDIAASYMAHSNDGPTDRFSFTLVPPPDFCPGARLEFAISYSANGVDYWDNNYGNNYGFECYAKTVPTEAENAWMHFL